MVKLYLGFCTLVWLGYGLFCGLMTEQVGGIVGYDLSYWGGMVEAKAMYGGAQVAIGLFCLLGLINASEYAKPAVMFSFIALSSLALFRLIGLLTIGPGLGLDFEDPLNGYNSGALWFFEVPFAVMAFLLLRSFDKQQA